MAYDITGSGARIRQLRIQSGYTQEKIARLLNIDQSYYGRIETGKRGCSVDLFVQLSALFGTSLDYLILGRSSYDASTGSDVTRLKTDIEELVKRLECFKESL